MRNPSFVLPITEGMHRELLERCREKKIVFLSTPFDIEREPLFCPSDNLSGRAFIDMRAFYHPGPVDLYLLSPNP